MESKQAGFVASVTSLFSFLTTNATLYSALQHCADHNASLIAIDDVNTTSIINSDSLSR